MASVAAFAAAAAEESMLIDSAGLGPPVEEAAGGAYSSQHICHCAIPTCITKYEDEVHKRKKYTAFVIEIRTYGGLQWTVDRRYRQFYTLNKVRPSLPSANDPRGNPTPPARRPARERAAPSLAPPSSSSTG